MAFKDMYELGGFEIYDNPELRLGLESLEEIRIERSQVALTAAKHIIERCGGETTDLRLYYSAMFGRSHLEGSREHDANLLTPLVIARTLSLSEGKPLLVRDVNFPEDNVDVGVVASFSEESFEPVKFEVSWHDSKTADFYAWQGGVAIAMRKVVHSADSFALADKVSKLLVCDTATWTSSDDGLEIHAAGTGGVEVVEPEHLDRGYGKKYHHRFSSWLRQYLEPTERKPLSPDQVRWKEGSRNLLIESAQAQGVSEAVATARSLSPSHEAFFEILRPYAEAEEPMPIDVKSVFASWHDAYDAQSLLMGIEGSGLVEVDQAGQLIVSPLGRETMLHLHDN